MKSFALPTLILSLWASVFLFGFAQDEPAPPALLSPDTELKAWVQFVDGQIDVHKATGGQAGIAEADAPYLYAFTTYNLPTEELRKDCETSLSFALNSCMYFKTPPQIRKPKRVPGSKTLLFIDVRDFGWEREWLDIAYEQQPFFLDPVVDHRLYNYARLKMGNVMFRADWWVFNTLDVTVQLDRDEKNLLYYILLYGKGNEPKDAADFQRSWQVDIKTLEVEQVETGVLIDQGRSGVSKHTRQLRRGRTTFGYYHETRDVKAYQKKRDFIEDPFATNFDASELIASHKNGTQVYLLTNGNGQGQKRVDFADNGIVTDKSDSEDARVRTPKSCIVCHAVGINPGTDAFKQLVQAGGKLFTYEKKVQQALESFYLNGWAKKIKADNELYAEAVTKATDLEPLKATAAYVRLYDWYRKSVSQEQAARECGMGLKDYLKNVKPNASGRLTQLFVNQDIPREVWDSTEGGGGYIQSMLLAKRIQAKAQPEKATPIPAKKTMVVCVPQATLWDDKQRPMVYLSQGMVVEILDESNDGYEVQSGSHRGWIRKENVRPQ